MQKRRLGGRLTCVALLALSLPAIAMDQTAELAKGTTVQKAGPGSVKPGLVGSVPRVGINPQPEPPIGKVGINPQPEPPGGRIGINPQPEPPGGKIGINPQPEPPAPALR